MDGDGDASTKRDDHETTEKQEDDCWGEGLLRCKWMPVGLKREGRLFVKVTAMHGIRRVWETKGTVQKTFWLMSILVCFAAMIALITFNIRDFINDNGSTQVNRTMGDNGLRLPKVTFCNNHPIKRSYVTKYYNSTGRLNDELLQYILLANRDPMMIGKSEQELKTLDKELQEYKTTREQNFTFREFFEQTGFTCEDVFKRCAFAGQQFNCCHEKETGRMFNRSLTEMGVCHSITVIHNQTTETENGGLQLILDAQTEDVFPMPIDPNQILNFTLSDGFRIFLEEPDMHTYRSSHGISVAPGQSIFSGIHLTQVYVLESKCRSDWRGVELKGRNTGLKYQARDCTSKCIAKVYNRVCRCAPLFFDVDSEYKSCTPMQAVHCSQEEEIRKATSLKEDTECFICEIECDRYDYQSYNSYGGPLSRDALNALNELYGNKTDDKRSYFSKNFVVVTIYYRELSSLVYAAVGVPSAVSLLSNIGGSAGLCLGFSALTFIEIVVLIFKALSYAFRKNDLDKKGVDYKENKRLEKAALDSLKERHKKKHFGGGDYNEENGQNPAERTPTANVSPVVHSPHGTGHQGLAPNLTPRAEIETSRGRPPLLNGITQTAIEGETIHAEEGHSPLPNPRSPQ